MGANLSNICVALLPSDCPEPPPPPSDLGAGDSSPDPEEQQENQEMQELAPSPLPQEDAEHHNQFENNANHENQDRAESPAKDATLEPESDDELFMNEGPSLDDDDEDDSFQETSAGFPHDNFEDSSNFVDEEDTTFGSPGLREAFTEGFNGTGETESLMEASRAGSADTSRRNRRKQFKPKNITARLTEEEEEVEEDKTVGGEESPLSDYRRSLLPGQERESSPMDLSAPRAPEADSDSGSESSQAAEQPRPKGGLSLVRPEILFGASKPPIPETEDAQPSPLSLLSSLSDLQGKVEGSDNNMANTMKDAFREVLKLYGVSSDVAENIMGGGHGQGRWSPLVSTSLVLCSSLGPRTHGRHVDTLSTPPAIVSSSLAISQSECVTHSHTVTK